MSDPAAQPLPGRPRWSSESGFLLVAVGSAVGLGNLWEFPYLAGRHGGGAFVLVYLAAVAVIAAPLLAAELIIGRRTRRNPVDAMASLARRERRSSLWQAPAWIGAGASLLMLAVYGVVAGWALAYLRRSLSGGLSDWQRGGAAQEFSRLLSDPGAMLGWHLVFLTLTGVIAAAGVRRGVERAARVLVPAIVLLLAALLAVAAGGGGRVGEALGYLLTPDLAKLDGAAVLQAVRHACFTLSLGVGVMTALGSYLPDSACIPRSSVRIATADAVVALVAGIALFPFLFAAGLQPAEGPTLAFVALPAAFAAVPGGAAAAPLFFLLLVLAALSSSVALLEPGVALLEDRLRLSRPRATATVAGAAALAGVVPVLAFNEWAGIRIGGEGLFAFVNSLLGGALLPLAAGGTALFAGRVLSRRTGREELCLGGGAYRFWFLMVRWGAPAGVALAVYGLS